MCRRWRDTSQLLAHPCDPEALLPAGAGGRRASDLPLEPCYRSSWSQRDARGLVALPGARSSWSQRSARGIVESNARSSWSHRDAIAATVAMIVLPPEPAALLGA